jgi:hypothetical protein
MPMARKLAMNDMGSCVGLTTGFRMGYRENSYKNDGHDGENQHDLFELKRHQFPRVGTNIPCSAASPAPRAFLHSVLPTRWLVAV